MKTLLLKTDFPKAPGGDRYEWKSAETKFSIPENGKYLLEVTASAKNAAQNRSTDDDDLRIALDGYDFGKYEVHEEKISWKGFGTASSWDGASLKGNSKTIYLFVELQKGEHLLQFFADKNPALQELKISQFEKDELFELHDQQPPTSAAEYHKKKTDRKGTPWMSFVFLGVKPKHFSIEATTKSAAQKKSTDGDNLKVVVNGKIVQNHKAPKSKKYKNFYFSGDLNDGKPETLTLKPEEFEFLEDSVELWHDERPSVTIRIELFNSMKEWASKRMPEKIKLKLYEFILLKLSQTRALTPYKYSKSFLRYSLTRAPKKLILRNNHEITIKVKKDEAYNKIRSILTEQIKKGVLNGQIHLENINFEKTDLKFALHGIKKLEFEAKPLSNNQYQVHLKLLDVYDFSKEKYDFKIIWPFVYVADELETNGLLKNFEIEIKISDTIQT